MVSLEVCDRVKADLELSLVVLLCGDGGAGQRIIVQWGMMCPAELPGQSFTESLDRQSSLELNSGLL